MGFLVWEFCLVGEYFVGGLLKLVCGIVDFGDIDGGGVVRFWFGVVFFGFVGGGGIICCFIVDFGKLVEGEGVDFCNGFLFCFGWLGFVVIGIVGFFGLLVWRVDNGWEFGWFMIGDKLDGKFWVCLL